MSHTPSHVIIWKELQLQEDGSYEEKPMMILDKKEQVLRNKIIPLVKVLWQHHVWKRLPGS